MNKVMKEFLNTAIYLLCVLGAVWLVITFVGQRTEVEGASMENTLHNGDNLIVDKLSYRFHDPCYHRRGDQCDGLQRVAGYHGTCDLCAELLRH